MKRRLSFTALVLLLFMTAFKGDPKILIGTWRGTAEHQNDQLVFTGTGHVYVIKGVDTVGGPDFVVDGTNYEMTYKADLDKTPGLLDIKVLSKKDGSAAHERKGLIELLPSGELKVCLDDLTDEHPKEFAKETTIVFRKMK